MEKYTVVNYVCDDMSDDVTDGFTFFFFLVFSFNLAGFSVRRVCYAHETQRRALNMDQ